MFCGECGVSVATPKLVEPATKPRPGDTAIIQRLDLPSTEFIGEVKSEVAKPVSTQPEVVKPARPRPTARPKPVPPAAPAVAVPPPPPNPSELLSTRGARDVLTSRTQSDDDDVCCVLAHAAISVRLGRFEKSMGRPT